MEYQFHVAALDSFREQLALSPLPDPQVGAIRDQEVADADQAPASAILGSLVGHLLTHAASDGRELDLLERAAKLWGEGLALYETLEGFRLQLETAIADPSDGAALQSLNTASAALSPLVVSVVGQDRKIKALRADIATLPHLPPHPRQEDLPIAAWGWGDIFPARRTEAFAREVRRQVTDTETSAFAFGVLSHYGAQAAGSAYLGQVVGGPRRSHRQRERLARNSVGSWVAAKVPGTPPVRNIAGTLKNAFPGGLPPAIEGLIQTAAANTYDGGVVPSLPDLQTGYQRLVRHLELLDQFALPAAPRTPIEPFLTRLFGDPSNPYVPTLPEDTGLVEAGEPPGPVGGGHGTIMPQSYGTGDPTGPAETPASTEAKCGAFWEALGWSVLFLLGGWFSCALRWGDGDRCRLWDDISQNWEAAFPNGVETSAEFSTDPQPLTASQVGNIAQSREITQLVGDLHNLQSLMWEGFQKARDYLALFGLVYPDGLLHQRRYSQYLTMTYTAAELGWPRLPDPGPRFDQYPASAVEQPQANSFAYLTGATPAAVLARVPQPDSTSAADVSMRVWEQMASGITDSTNFDLDADRGWRHPCWDVQGSINDQPVDVLALDFDQT